MADALLAELARAAGIHPEYWDVSGKEHRAPPDVQRALLEAMGFACASDEDLEDGLHRLRAQTQQLAPVIVLRAPVRDVVIPRPTPFAWRLSLEDGDVLEGTAEHRIHFGLELPLGYHRLSVDDQVTALIVAPDSGYAPDWLSLGDKKWGVACHLYSVTSDRNWGIGDFGDLKTLMRMTADAGGEIVAVNPFHVLSPHEPEQASPYWPSSRTYINPLYLDLSHFSGESVGGAVPGALVDYTEVSQRKLDALKQISAQYLGDPGLANFIREGGESLRNFCIFASLSERHRGPWTSWPRECRDPASAAVRAWASDHEQDVRGHAVIQWLAERQLADVATSSRAVLMRDLAVGVSPDGAEAWHRQELYPDGVRFGAPPDPLGPDGQNWGLPPPNPHVLRASAYEPFITTVRANMRHAGSLRIDHVMALERLFWIPPGGTAADGAYVGYPVDDLFAVLALESLRAKCLIVGEDLGTVPVGFRERMARDNILSTRLFYFERHDNEFFKRPDLYPARSVAQATTHDLPTLAGYWTGTDIRIRLSLKPGGDDEAMERERAKDRALVLAALRDQGLIDDRPISDIAVDEIIDAVHAFLGATGSQLALINLSDVIAMTTQLNVPGTTDEYPNWRATLTQTLEQIVTGNAWPALGRLMRRTRARTVA